MKFAIHDRVRVKSPSPLSVAGLVGEVVAYDASANPTMPYVVVEDGDAMRRPRYFAESELERAPIEARVVEGIVEDDHLIDHQVTCVLDDFDGDEVRIIIEVLKRGGAS